MSGAHRGRIQSRPDTLVQKRIREFPGQSFAEHNEKLLCQACNKYIQAAKGTVKRHLGLDNKQRNATNNGKQHKDKLSIWHESRRVPVDYSNIKSGWVSSALVTGLNASQTANLAKNFFGKFPVENSGTIPVYVQGLFVYKSHSPYFLGRTFYV